MISEANKDTDFRDWSTSVRDKLVLSILDVSINPQLHFCLALLPFSRDFPFGIFQMRIWDGARSRWCSVGWFNALESCCRERVWVWPQPGRCTCIFRVSGAAVLVCSQVWGADFLKQGWGIEWEQSTGGCEQHFWAYFSVSCPSPPTQLTCCLKDLTITDFYLMATSPSLGNKTRITSRRQWKPCTSWAFHTMRSCVSLGASGILRVFFSLLNTLTLLI